MSDRLPDPVGVAGRRRAYARALAGLEGDPYAVPAAPTRRGRRAIQPATNPLTGISPPLGRGGMFAQALEQPGAFQGISTLPSAPQAPVESTPVPGAAQRISTRVPTDVAAEARDAPHTRSDLEVGLEAARQSPDAWKKNAELIRGYGHLNTAGMSDDEVHEAFVRHLTDNLEWLHNQIPGEIRASSKRWYDGARKIADRWAQEYQYQPHQMAGVLAALSPQKDWFQNVDLARRILDISRDRLDTPASEQMRGRLQAYANAVKNPEAKAAMQAHVDAMGSKTLGQVTDPMQRAMWIRAYDEAHNPRDYQVVSPEGDLGDYAKTKSGKTNQKVAWGSFKEIHKAVQAMSDPSLENISRHMGGNHKVRNFYNNIIAPMFGRDATIDTHAIAAANMMPLGSNHPLVAAGLGLKGSSSAGTGVRGLYPHYIEAHRRAAERLGILPRELQSITWEGIRGTYLPEQKRNKQFVASIDNIWRDYAEGKIDGNTARERSLQLAAPEGIRDPKWHRSGVTDDAE